MNQSLLSVVNEESAAPYLRVVKSNVALTTRQLVLACKGIHPGPKAVLAEICNLHEKGGRECYDANNNHLADKLGITIPMVSRHIRKLSERGLLIVDPRAGKQRRVLTPVAELREAYRSGNVANITEVVTLLAKSGNLTTSEPYQSGNADLTEVVTLPYRSGKHNRSLIKEKNTNPSYVAELENQLAEMRQELNAAYAASAERGNRILELTTELAGLKRRTVRPTKDPRPIAERFAAEAAVLDEEATSRWERFCKWESDNPLPNVYALKEPLRPAELTKLVNEWDGNEVKDILVEMENYADLSKKKSAYLTAHTWLKRARKRQEDEDARREQASARYRLTNPPR